MIWEEPHRLDDFAEADDAVLLLTADMMVGPANALTVEDAPPPALARGTGPALRPGRGLAMAGGLHLLVAGVLLALVRLHWPAPPPEGPVISVVMETTPQGNTAVATQPPVTPPAPAPPQKIAPVAAPKPVAPPPPVTRQAVLPLPAPPAPRPPPAPARIAAVAPALVQGTKLPSHKTGPMLVLANRPAVADAGNQVPVYSDLSRSLGEQGRVSLRVFVLPDGVPGDVQVVTSSGYARLDHAARDAVLSWHFQPALKNGEPVASFVSYWFKFELQ
jgi:protein TonB